MKGKENGTCLTEGIQGKSCETGGMKRQWFLRDEEEDSENSLENNKQLKGQAACQAGTSMEVGVISLKWPQADQ